MLNDAELVALVHELESDHADDERILRERRRAGDLPFDRRQAPGASLADLDLRFFREEYLPSAVAGEVLARNERTVEEQLASLRFTSGESPSHGAVLVFGQDPLQFVPGAYVQFLRIEGTALGDPIRSQRRLDGPLHQVTRQLDDLIDLNISVATDITTGRRESVEPDYPSAALQQIARNALIHRNYESSHAPIRIYWFNDRVEVHSPGGLFGQVTARNFGTGATDYRNPLVAEALATLGYVQRFGYGIPLARKLLRDNGNPDPEFTFEVSTVLATVRSVP